MASKGPRSKLDHETRAKRQKALEAPREPHRPKAHWDHVLEEMVWLSKDFESERKWKLAQAKKVALRASKGMLDQATRGEKKLKEEEQRLRKVALNISKDVKKFWLKIEKLVLYKHQIELDEKKKKALDKQLHFLLGQTERYSTMLAENLGDSFKTVIQSPAQDTAKLLIKSGGNYNDQLTSPVRDTANILIKSDINGTDEPLEPNADMQDDEDFDIRSEDESEDDEQTLEKDEALITEEEREEELAALQNEVDLPLEDLLKHYTVDRVTSESSPEKGEDGMKSTLVDDDYGKDNGSDPSADSKADTSSSLVRRSRESNIDLPLSGNDSLTIETSIVRNLPGKDEEIALTVETSTGRNLSDEDEEIAKDVPYNFDDEQDDGDFSVAGEEKDDETTLSEEEELAKADPNNPTDEIALLQKESEIPIEELLARYKKDLSDDEASEDESAYASALSEDFLDSSPHVDSKGKEKGSSVDDCPEPSSAQPLEHPHGKHEASPDRKSDEGRDSEDKIADAAAAARSAQPTGNTFSTTKVRTKFPFLLKHSLREYQHIGLDWLVTMYEKRLNGILADEMGLGKTIMTIALLAHLACEKGIWGPHLIVVPTSVMLNWETEFLRWCPAFKILTYFGSAKERKFKRQGWMKQNTFHICITTYRLVIQDSKIFKRKKWKYLILDEAHLIKNWKSQRWQTLLNFNSKRRILLTGTPLQNDLMELWSLMHFLMPHVFQSHQEFKDWFSNPISGMIEGQERVSKEVVDRLHNVLRPFILRRLKRDVERQLPLKHEHVINCRLSRRQRNLYEDFIASSETQATLSNGNFFGMISVIMQLRKVCNHPDLFEGRPIVSSFDMAGIDIQLSSSVCTMLSPGPFSSVNLKSLGILFTDLDLSMTSWESEEVKALATPSSLIKERVSQKNLHEIALISKNHRNLHGMNIFDEIRKAVLEERRQEAEDRAASIAWWNSLRCNKKPLYSTTLQGLLTVKYPFSDIHHQKVDQRSYLYSSKLAEIVISPVERLQEMIHQVECFMFAIPAARAPPPVCWCSKTRTPVFLHSDYKEKCAETMFPLLTPVRPAIVRRQLYFPDRRLIQFDCGKLQELAVLLRRLKSEGHRALIFTQMTKMLDILEAFINLYGYTYMRLDGSTPPEERQTLMQRFNTNSKIFLFILSTRSGGVGINLVGADTVIFYDSDWNPAMDQQAQDRCHRIGQTRTVHIYRLISESTIEENILKKANQKRALDDLVIQRGDYNTEFFKKLDPMELLSGQALKNIPKEKNHHNRTEVSVSNADVEAALKHAEDEADYMALKKVEEEEAVDNQEFTEEAIGKLDDDEFVNEDDVNADEPTDQGGDLVMSNKENGFISNDCAPIEEKALNFAVREDDVDMLADVRQMAAAAAASGQTILSFENQLRPIDRYAIYFLELWDPVIDKGVTESEARFEEAEWELERIEKYKEEMEAEIDEDEEPLVYEMWDADFATEAYRQKVEALAQHQLMEDLENEAKEKEAEDGDFDAADNEASFSKPKPKKKKVKKAKFKSLKKGSLSSDLKPVKEESEEEPMSMDDDVFHDEGCYSDVASPSTNAQRKRKKDPMHSADEEKSSKKKPKKNKKALSEKIPFDLDSTGKRHDASAEVKHGEGMSIELEQKSAGRSRTGGKISITCMPVKRILMIRPEKLKKGNVWSRDCVPLPDSWLPQEDAVLCAIVHEYGPCWNLVSETLYGMTAGGFYRGRFRHPVHCCERYRELIQRHVLSAPDHSVNEKISNTGSGKALLKVTEDNMRTLLNFAAEKPDREFVLQKHYTALLSSVWKVSYRNNNQQKPLAARNCLYFNGSFLSTFASNSSKSSVREPVQRVQFSDLAQSSKKLAAALDDACSVPQDSRIPLSDKSSIAPVSQEHLDIALEFPNQMNDEDTSILMPPVVNLSIRDSEPLAFLEKAEVDGVHRKAQVMAENRYREAARACFEGSQNWASSAFPANDFKSRSVSKPQSLGKHKLASDSTKPPKSKSRKTSMDHFDVQHSFTEQVFPNNPNLRFEPTENMIEGLTDDSDGSSGSSMLFPPTIEELDPVQYDCQQGFISGLDDYSVLADHTDIG